MGVVELERENGDFKNSLDVAIGAKSVCAVEVCE